MLREGRKRESYMRAFIFPRYLYFFCLTLGILVFAQEPVSIGGKVTDAKGLSIPRMTSLANRPVPRI